MHACRLLSQQGVSRCACITHSSRCGVGSLGGQLQQHEQRRHFSSVVSSSSSARLSSTSSLLSTSTTSTVISSNSIASSCGSSPSASVLSVQRRHQATTGAIPSSTMGLIKPYKGFVSDEVQIDISAFGGQYARGLFTKKKMLPGKEIIRVPAFATYVGDEPRREQVFILAQQIFSEIVSRGHDDPYTRFVQERVFSMMNSGRQYFLKEQDLQALIDAVPGSSIFLEMGQVSPSDIQKLPQQLEFNRYDVEFRGKKGICVFPEATYFNHMCIPNVEITISHELSEGGFVLSARICRPVEAGDELFINYIPDNDLPLSRLVLAMRSRWGFECMCSSCRSRLIGICCVYVVAFFIPFIWWVRSTFEDRFRERARRLN